MMRERHKKRQITAHVITLSQVGTTKHAERHTVRKLKISVKKY
jgi:hypothetical protein